MIINEEQKVLLLLYFKKYVYVMFVRIFFSLKYSINIIWSALQQKLMEKPFVSYFMNFHQQMLPEGATIQSL